MNYLNEIDHINSIDFKLGEYIYMGMGLYNKHRICISVAYKIDYCLKKAKEFVKASNDTVIFDKINKIKIGELIKCDQLLIKDLRL